MSDMTKNTIFAGGMILGFVCVLAGLLVMTHDAEAGGIYSPITFYRDVSVSNIGAVTGIGVDTSGTNGFYTNGAYTNYYRVSGTNNDGRIPLSAVTSAIFTGSSSNSNSVTVSWAPRTGVRSYVVERSFDNATWTGA